MKRQWKTALFKITFSLLTDICLACLGLDDLANYGQFIFEQEIISPLMVTNCVVLCQ
jgi:hypothetical protein